MTTATLPRFRQRTNGHAKRNSHGAMVDPNDGHRRAATKPCKLIASLDVPIEMIEVHPAVPRKEFPEDRIEALAQSLMRDDMLQRPIVRQLEDGTYQLLSGLRRLRAAVKLGWTELPVTVRGCNDVEALRIIGSDQLLQEEWNAIELAHYLKHLCTPPDDGGAGLTREQAAAMFGRNGPWASDHVLLLSLPEEIQAMVISGEMSRTTARLLVPDAQDAALLNAVIEDIRQHPAGWQTREQAEFSVHALKSAPGSQAVQSGPKREKKERAERFSRKRVETLLQPFAKNARHLRLVIEVAQSLLSSFEQS